MINTIWQRLVEPPDVISNIEERRLAKILAVMLVSVLPLMFIVGIVVMPIVSGADVPWQGATFWPATSAITGSIVSYILLRQGKYYLATVIYILIFILTPIMAVALDYSALNLPIATLSVGGVLLASVLFTSRYATIAAGFGVIGAILVLPFLIPNMIFDDIASTAAANATNSTIIIVFVYLRDRLEQQRKAELQAAHTSLEKHSTDLQQALNERDSVAQERTELIVDLESKNAELERFAYTVSHDLKSPLITIGGYLGYLEQDALKGDTERLQKDINYIRKASNQMQLLLDELLELSRIGRIVNPPEEVAFAGIVQDALNTVQGRLNEKIIEVTVAEDMPTVYCDRVRITEVVQNLVDNAAKFIQPEQQGRIEIGWQKASDEQIFFVRDNGIGIDPQYHDKVFDLFEKLETNNEGTGVGLALVKRIIEFHHGRVWLESDGKNNGSTFYFTLPVPNLTET